MSNIELDGYIRECISRGISSSEIANTLISAGWNKDEVNQAISVLTGATISPTPARSSVAQIAQTSQAPQEMTPSTFTPTQTLSTNQTQTVSPFVATEAVQSTEVTSRSSRAKKIALILGMFLFLALASSATGYYLLVVRATPSPEERIFAMQTAMKEVTSYNFDGKFLLDLKIKPGKELTETAGNYLGKGSEGALKLNINANGSVKVGESATTSAVDLSYDVDGNASYGAMSVVLDGATDIRTLDQMLYVRLTKIPKLLSMAGMSAMVDPWKDKWISFDLSSTSSLAKLSGKYSSTSPFASSALSKADRDKANAIIMKDWPFQLSTPKEASIMVGGIDTNHYQFTVDEKKFETLLSDLIELSPNKESIAENPEQLKEAIHIAAQFFASSTGDLYIGKQTPYLYQMNMHIPVEFATSAVAITGTMDIVMNQSSFNAITPITAPSESTEFPDVYKQLTGRELGALSETAPIEENVTTDTPEVAAAKYRDAKRISDLGQLQLALELYFDAHKRYPSTLNMLVSGKMIPQVPVDPSTKKQYVYVPLHSASTYGLGASLERADNSALFSDADLVTSLFLTADTKGCRGEKDRYCYDIKP